MITGPSTVPAQQVHTKPEPDPNYPEWLVHEEWALLEVRKKHILNVFHSLIFDITQQTLCIGFYSLFKNIDMV